MYISFGNPPGIFIEAEKYKIPSFSSFVSDLWSGSYIEKAGFKTILFPGELLCQLHIFSILSYQLTDGNNQQVLAQTFPLKLLVQSFLLGQRIEAFTIFASFPFIVEEWSLTSLFLLEFKTER